MYKKEREYGSYEMQENYRRRDGVRFDALELFPDF